LTVSHVVERAELGFVADDRETASVGIALGGLAPIVAGAPLVAVRDSLDPTRHSRRHQLAVD
jgi:hypothetical protein